MNYYNVAVFANIDNVLTYKSDYSGYSAGLRVVVPLGRKLATGVITEVNAKKPELPESSIKAINGVVDDEAVLDSSLLKLGLWASEHYLCAPGLMFSTMLSALYKVNIKKTIKLIEYNESEKFTSLEKMVITYLEKRRGKKSNIKDIEKNVDRNVNRAIASLAEKGVIESEDSANMKISREKSKEADKGIADHKDIELTKVQSEVFALIKKSLGTFKTFLLFGTTGSGKTEIYIKSAEEAIKRGKQAVILVPEIFLTPQILQRFKAVFEKRCAVFHSGLSESERYHEWLKMKNGEVDVVIGTRSAVFAPFRDIGLIVVDEEFDSSYKQENDPRYNARDVAVYRGRICNAVVVLGSATPAVESYNNAVSGKYEMLKIDERVQNRPMPEIRIVDMARDWQNSSNLFLSNELLEEMRISVEKGEQAILFINRRGFSNYVFCKSCGHVEKCKSCDIPLVFHKNKGKLICHYCDSSKDPIKMCEVCGKPITYRGTGTQRVEEVVQKLFPDKKIARIDIDSMKDKKEYINTYNRIKNKEVDILIGTQMIAKGFDFPEVTFVGVVGIDSVLNLPDFRADERGFQLLMQVAGRTGRGDKRGIVVVQTYVPDSEGVKYLRKYQIEEFYNNQIIIRKALNYPPFSYITQLIISNEDYGKCEKESEKVYESLDSFLKKNKMKNVEILGPAEAPLSKIRNRFRFSILLKSSSRKSLRETGKHIKKTFRGRDVSIIVDPGSTL